MGMERKRKTSTSSSTSSGTTSTPTSSSQQTSPVAYYYTSGSRKVNVHKPPYTEEWSRCFQHGKIQLKNLRQHALEGDLRSSKMRSIYWRLFLRILPLDKDEWYSIVERCRYEYQEIKCRHSRDSKEFNEGDPQSNNPLSEQENCPWSQFFYNSELKEQIKRDVDRSFPEIPLFKNPETREIMINVLFIYAKEHPHIEYKQGMHEILGPLLFVLNYDQENFITLKEANIISSLNENDKRLLGFLNDPHFREHDVYQMFTGMMLLIESWYIYGDENLSKSDDETNRSSSSVSNDNEYISNSIDNLKKLKKKRKISISTYQSNLFKQSVDDDNSKSLIIDKLKEIMECFLKEYDNVLYNHLKNLNILPQVYGIRWLRLLFGREFPFPDLLYIWDVILSDDDPLVMIDFIFLSLLLQIREQLLSGDYSCCLQYLMRYPPIIDVTNFVKFALHIRSPKKYSMPKMSGPMNFSNITLTGQLHPNADKKKYISIFNDQKDVKKNSRDKENDSLSVFSQASSNDNNWDEGGSHHHKNSIENIRNSPELEMMPMNRRHTFTNGSRTPMLSSTEIQEYESMKKQIDSLQQATINSETKQFEASQRLYEIISGIKQLNIEKDIKKQLAKSIGEVAAKLSYSSINEASIRNVTLPTDASPTREGVEVAIEAKSPDNV
uniref:Rab-GAP TBC domain-containing protein n=1 Tax=Strongyloides papillosus TaxID=174720 RepID=A0A0N5BQG3_STREA